MDDFWIFGYGSLMWHPGFSYSEKQLACIFGYHRSLCIYSCHYRGTPQQPGLVLGLSRGGSCRGMAFHIPRKEAQQTYDYLVAREQINGVYRQRQVRIYLADGRNVQSLVFVADCRHPQYAGPLACPDMARIVANARGKTGSNLDYVFNTLNHLRELNVRDHGLESLARHLCPVTTQHAASL